MKAVIFDLDGTLLDVRAGLLWQFQQLVRQYDNEEITAEAIAAMAHGTTEQLVRALVKNTEVPFDEICKRHAELRLESYDRFLKLYQGVDELLPTLKRMGLDVAALTAGNKMTVDCLERLGIHHHFDVVIDASHVTRTKPDPEGLQLILQKLGHEPRDVVMVGDTVADITVGQRAGVGKTVGVSHGFGLTEALQAAGADHIINDIPSLLDVIE